MVEINHSDFIDAVSIMLSLWLMAWASMEKGDPDSPRSPTMRGPLARIQGRQGLNWYKNF